MMGSYLYGFTEARFQPQTNLRGLAGAPVRIVGFRDLAAVVSHHPVQRLVPRRANLEPHHRIVRHMSSCGPLVPAAFGHISESEEQIVGVMRENYEGIRSELERLANKIEMSVKLRWNVDNIFEYFVRMHKNLRELRDRVFCNHAQPSFDEKLKIGSLFEALLGSERERLTGLLLGALQEIICESTCSPARDEKSVCECSLLMEKLRVPEFAPALERAAALFDSNFTLQWNGPWPPYSFVRLQLQTEERPAIA